MVARKTTNRQTNRNRRGVTNQRSNSSLRSKVQKTGQKSLRSGSHPQQSFRGGTTGARKKLVRAGARLGPMGELGDDVIFEVGLRESLLAVYKQFGAPRSLNKTELWRDLRKMVYIPLQLYLDKQVKIWVPSDTDDLRDSLRASYRSPSSKIRGFPFQVVLNTSGIPYAGPVNNMPQAWLRHQGTHPPTKNSLHSGNLNDPNARKGWYGLLLLNGRNMSKNLMKGFIQAQTLKLSTTFQLVGKKRTRYNYIKSLFQIKYK